MIILYTYFKKLFLNLKGFSNGKVVSLTKKEYGSTGYFYKSSKIFKINVS